MTAGEPVGSRPLISFEVSGLFVLAYMDRYDALTLFGVGMVAAGLYFVYPPLALIVPGIVVFVIGLFAGRGRR